MNSSLTRWALRLLMEMIQEVSCIGEPINWKKPSDNKNIVNLFNICSDSFSHFRRRPPLPYRRSWTTNGLYKCLPWNISYHKSWLRFSSGHWPHSRASATRSSSQYCDGTPWRSVWLAYSRNLRIKLWTLHALWKTSIRFFSPHWRLHAVLSVLTNR